MTEKNLAKTFDLTIKAAIVILTLVLLWFAFVYYPQITSRIKIESQKVGLVNNVEASSKSLPYDNSHFRIEYLQKQNVYLVNISASTMDQYNQYKADANLTLKNILSLDRLCNLNIVYTTDLPFVKPQVSQVSC